MIEIASQNFWKLYPELTLAPKLDKFYKKDTSKNKNKSSHIMWAIHFCESLDSKYYNLPDKYKTITGTFLKDITVDWKQLDDIIEVYKEVVLSDAERGLSLWNETMRLRSRSLKEMYQDAFDGKDTDELVKLDKMLSTTSKMFDDYKKIKQDYEAEKLIKKGSGNQSMSDSDAL